MCKMINIRANFVKLILLLKNEKNNNQDFRIKDLQLLAKFSRPFDRQNIVQSLLDNFAN